MHSNEQMFLRDDGEQRVSLTRRRDGLFTLGEETRFWEEPHPATGEGFYYWAPTERETSLLETREEAQREALARYPWMRAQIAVK